MHYTSGNDTFFNIKGSLSFKILHLYKYDRSTFKLKWSSVI